VTDEDLIPDVDALADEGVAGDLAVAPYPRVLLDLDEAADPRIVSDFAPICVYEIEQADIRANANVNQ
jgi:hypothetical protein